MKLNAKPFILAASVFILFAFSAGALFPVNAFAAKHPPFYLLDSDGDIINPMTGENADKPYSSYNTCDLCHSYDDIVKGYHFQQGAETINDHFSKERPWVLSDGMFGKY